MKKKDIDTSTLRESGTNNPIEEIANGPVIKPLIPDITDKQLLENLYKDMVKHGIHSIGQLEVKISQQK